VFHIAEAVAGKRAWGETQFRRLVSWLGGYKALNHLLHVVEAQRIEDEELQVSIFSFHKIWKIRYYLVFLKV